MINFSVLILLIFSIKYVSKFFLKNGFLLSQSGELHQKFTSIQAIPLIGGSYLFILFSHILIKLEFFNLFYSLILIFILGLLADQKKIVSPKKRLLFQFLILIFLVIGSQLEISNTRIELVDNFIDNRYINLLFVIFCLLILINGSNFIDGLNGLLIGYYIAVSVILIMIGYFDFLKFDLEMNIIFFISLISLFVFNTLNKLYLGDNGVYVISLFFGFLLINFHQNFLYVSPYFVILLVWYPCFENLFSIIRKFKIKRSPINPDTNHLHQLLFHFLKKKINKSHIIINNLSSLLIICVNFIFFFISSLNIYSTNLQLFLIMFAILLYTVSYILLFRFKYRN